jgi:O-antigen/teichoic acid export membrane protein
MNYLNTKIHKNNVSSFYKNIFVMLRGTLVAQVIATIGALYLAKIYGEEAYGFFGVFISITGITSIICSLQLDKFIVISKNSKESTNWYNFVLLLIPVATLIISLLLYVVSNYVFIEKLSKNILLLSAVGTLVIALITAHENFFTFQKEFSTISNSKIFLTIGNLGLQILLYSSFNLLGLIIGFLISQCSVLLYYVFKNRRVISTTNFTEIKKGLQSNTSILKFLLPSNTLNSIANSLMPILILAFFGVKEAGVYFFSQKILGIPLFLISSSVGQVYFQKSSVLLRENKEELRMLTKKIVRTNLLIMLAFLLLINTVGMYLLDSFFEGKWIDLRPYTLLLSILVFARVSFNPISSLIVVLDKNLESLLFNSYLFIINLVAIFVGYFYHSITLTIIILAVFGGIGYLVFLAYFLNHLKQIAKKDV